MKRAHMILIYLILSAGVVGTAIPFGFELRERLYAEETEAIGTPVIPPTIPPQPTPTLPEWRKVSAVARLAKDTSVFKPVITPMPTATRTPKPSDTPTPVVVARGYKVSLCMGSRKAIIEDYKFKKKVVSVGEVVEEPTLGDFKIISIDPKLKRVEVEAVEGGYRSFIEEGTEAKPKK